MGTFVIVLTRARLNHATIMLNVRILQLKIIYVNAEETGLEKGELNIAKYKKIYLKMYFFYLEIVYLG